jgi:pimeloyl-ACP methyl ester carboxylesterase
MKFAGAVVILVALACCACDAGTPSLPPAARSAPSAPSATAESRSVEVAATPAAEPASTATASQASSFSGPAFAEVPCPIEVTSVVVVVPTCGVVTVPERRGADDAQTVRVFVVRVDPVDVTASDDPMAVVGDTLGNTMEYGSLVTVAQRTGRVAYLVDRRGTGQSEPRLDCPEIVAAAPASLAVRTSDPAAMEPVLAAVSACRARLDAAGVDVAAFDLEQSALDVEDVRIAVGAPPWNVIGFGTSSRLALEVARRAPGGVRSVVLDSPVLPQGPDPAFNLAAARASVEEVATLCAAEPACHRRYPDVAATLDNAMASLDRKPAVLPGDEAKRAPVIVLDGVRFGRVIRGLLAEQAGQSVATVLPWASAAIAGRLADNAGLAARIGGDDGLCFGYHPECSRVVHGSLLTTMCRDIVPLVDRDAYLADSASVPGMAQAFAANPYAAACAAWNVPPADPSGAAPVATTIPVLALTGQFDAFTGPLAAVHDGMAGLAEAEFLAVPNQAYNVFGYDECPRKVRRQWLDDLGATLDTSCFASLQPVVALRP